MFKIFSILLLTPVHPKKLILFGFFSMAKDKFGETCKRHEIQSSSIEDVNFHIKNGIS